MKHPPKQFTDAEAYQMLEDFINNGTTVQQAQQEGQYEPAQTVKPAEK